MPLLRASLLWIALAALTVGNIILLQHMAYGGDFQPSGNGSGGAGGGRTMGGIHTAPAAAPLSYGPSHVIVCDVINHRCSNSHPGGQREIVKFHFVDRETVR